MTIRVKTTMLAVVAALFAGGAGFAQNPPAPAKRPAGPPRPTTQSPASPPRPTVSTTQTYPADLVRAGEARFSGQCGFCHGRDAAGGESGPDLTRSKIVAEDVRGDKLGPFLKEGRASAGMPAFNLSAEDLNAMVAFLHTQMEKFAALGGGRRSVEPEDLAVGNAADGRAYFEGKGGCTSCHSATGDLAGVGKKYVGLALLRRMLYPSGPPAPPATGKATFTLASGQTVIAPLLTEDEFSVTVLDPLGARQTYSKTAVKVKTENPLDAHFTQLSKYTDADMHNVYAYLETLK